ncbi:MAG: YtxH domain-containing protein [Chitinophagaceae bacterium]
MNNTTKIMVAIATAAAIGTIAGVLLAPDKGSETRRKISDEGKKLAADVKDKINKGKEKITGLKEEFEKAVLNKIEEFS